MSGKNLTLQEVKDAQRAYTKLLQTNKFEISAEVVSKEEILGKEVIDRETHLPISDPETGENRRYPTRYLISIAFKGASKEISVSEKWYSDLNIADSIYLFTGYIGIQKVFGKDIVDTIFTGYREI